MATIATTLPPARRRPRYEPAGGRATYPEIYFVKRIDNSRLRREVDPEKRRECFGLLGLGLLVFLVGFLCAWQHFRCLRYGYQIEHVKSEQAAQEEWNHQLRLEHAALADPQRIDRLARQKLGLEPPAPQQVIQIDNSPAGAAVGDPEFARNLPQNLPGGNLEAKH